MYLGYWGMSRFPFENTHDSELFVETSGSALALTKLRYAFQSELGAALITGPAGTGKTELAKKMLDELGEAGWVAAYLISPTGKSEDILTIISDLLGGPGSIEGQPAMETLLAHLMNISHSDSRACLVVDELHTVTDPIILETFRMLLNIEDNGRKVLNILLVGQEDSRKKLDDTSGFSTHMSLIINTAPMDIENTKKYILYRLKMVGCTRGIFTRHAAEMVHGLSGGVPRNINRIGELCLITGYGLGVKKITPEIVTMAAQDLGLMPEDASPYTYQSRRKELEDNIDILAGL